MLGLGAVYALVMTGCKLWWSLLSSRDGWFRKCRAFCCCSLAIDDSTRALRITLSRSSVRPVCRSELRVEMSEATELRRLRGREVVWTAGAAISYACSIPLVLRMRPYKLDMEERRLRLREGNMESENSVSLNSFSYSDAWCW